MDKGHVVGIDAYVNASIHISLLNQGDESVFYEETIDRILRVRFEAKFGERILPSTRWKIADVDALREYSCRWSG